MVRNYLREVVSMEYINTIPLIDTITAFQDSGSYDEGGEPTYTKTTASAKVFERNITKRDNDRREFEYGTALITKLEINSSDLIYIGTTTETDPKLIEALEVQKIHKMTSFTGIVGYKIWL